jgi:hypothetical protein
MMKYFRMHKFIRKCSSMAGTSKHLGDSKIFDLSQFLLEMKRDLTHAQAELKQDISTAQLQQETRLTAAQLQQETRLTNAQLELKKDLRNAQLDFKKDFLAAQQQQETRLQLTLFVQVVATLFSSLVVLGSVLSFLKFEISHPVLKPKAVHATEA